MYQLAVLYLACILAGFALVKLPVLAFLHGLSYFFCVIGVLAIIIFALALLYLGVKALLKKI